MTEREPKPTWQDLPLNVRAALEQYLGENVEAAEIAWGGFGPTPTFLLQLSDGQRRFVKGIDGLGTKLMSKGFHTERKVYDQLYEQISTYAPSYFGTAAVDRWQFIVLEDLGPSHNPPWKKSEAARAIEGLAQFHQEQPNVDGFPEWVDRFPEWAGKLGRDWRWSKNETDRKLRAEVAGSSAARLDDWFRSWSEQGTESSRRSSVTGHRFLHHDVRSDNLRLVDGRLVLFDWASVRLGPPERDFLGFATTLHLEAGFSLSEMIAWYTNVRPLDQESLLHAALSSVGFFADQSWRPEIPGLPRLRSFQKEQLRVGVEWVHELNEDPEPLWLAAVLSAKP